MNSMATPKVTHSLDFFQIKHGKEVFFFLHAYSNNEDKYILSY